MGAYTRALLGHDVREEEASLQKKAKKKSLWGSIGRTVGGLGVMALTGGAVNPVTLGLLTGGASFLGGAIGAKASGTGDLSKQGKFFKSDREDIQKELGAFGTQNLMSSLKSGLQAGLGQAAKLQKAKLFDKPIVAAPTTKQGLLKSMDFEGSLVGKSLEKGTAAGHASKIAKADKLYGGDRTTAMKDFQFGKGDVTAFDYAEESKYLKSLERTNVLEPVSYEKAPSVMDQDIMGSFLEGSLTPTGEGYDPGDEIYRQQNRGAFMDELELSRSLDKRLGSTFGLPSTTRGYDYRAVSADKAAKWQDILGLGDR